MTKRILITGSKGFLGGKFKDRVNYNGVKVIDYDIVDGDDILDLEKLTEKAKDCDAIWHFAAIADLNWARENPNATMDINVQGTYNVACAGFMAGAQVNYISTCCVYGNQEVHPSDETTLPNPTELYACSKLAGEYCVLAYHKMYKMPFNIVRIPTVYGDGMRPALGVHIFLEQALAGKPITVHGTGEQTRTLVYVSDVIEAIFKIEDKGIKNQIINVSGDEEISAIQMAEMIKELVKSGSEIQFIQQRPGQTMREKIATSKLKSLTGWTQKISFKEGIEKTYNWFINKRKNGGV